MGFAFALWFDSCDILEDGIIMRLVRGDHLPDDIPLFALECDDFRSHMSAVDTELESPKFVIDRLWNVLCTLVTPIGGKLVVGYCSRRELALTFRSLDWKMSALFVVDWPWRLKKKRVGPALNSFICSVVYATCFSWSWTRCTRGLRCLRIFGTFQKIHNIIGDNPLRSSVVLVTNSGT